MWRAKLEDKYTVVCKKCGKEAIDSLKKPNQKYLKFKCPYCGYIPEEVFKKIKSWERKHNKK